MAEPPEGQVAVRWLALGRTGVVTVLAVALLGAHLSGRPLFPLAPVLALLAVSYLLSAIYLVLLGRVRNPVRLAEVQIYGDVILQTILIYLTGGPYSVFPFLYLVSILTASIVVAPRESFGVATLAVFMHGLMLGAQFYRWLPPAGGHPLARNVGVEGSLTILLISANFCASFIMAYLGTYLAGRLRQARGQAHRSEASLAALQALHEDIVQSVASGLLTFDRRGTVTSANRTAEALCGRRETEIRGARWEALFPDAPPFPTIWGDLESGGARRARSETHLARPDGSRMAVGMSLSFLRRGRGAICSFQDLTEIKRMEEQVRQADRLAAIGRLAAGLAHEIRNPIGSIRGSVEVLRGSLNPQGDDRRLMDIVLRESDRLDAIIRDFLQFSRPPHLVRVPTDLSGMLDEILLMLSNHGRRPGCGDSAGADPPGHLRANRQSRRRPLAGAPGALEPVPQRRRGDAAGRRAARGRARRDAGNGTVHGAGHRRGHRGRHHGCRAHPGLRALLHDEAPGHRARAGHRAPHRRGSRRRDAGAERALPGHPVHDLTARERGVRPVIERVLVVDDDQSLREFLTITLGREGFEVVAAASGPEALRAMAETPADLALVDLKMPGMDGLETLRRLKELSETVAVVIVTAFATTETAIQALKEGAYDYLIKPFKIDELKLVVRKALEERRLRWENQRLRREVELRYTLGNMVGKSTKVQELFSTISRLAESRATVLLTGESGTGKTLLAKTIHFNSSRKNGPFVAVNCAAIPSELMESELFGHVRGAFTGAIANKQGLFETADGGTLLLDEISEMSTHLQAKLLRVLEDKEIRPVGGTKAVRVEVRIVAATNRDLAQAMARGTFREDLFYRLNVISVALPSLRERREDIPLLANHFLQKFTELAAAPAKVLSPEALACLEAYAWPGNIRELENVIERAVTLEPGPIIRPESLPESLRRPRAPDAFHVDFPAEGLDLDKLMEQIERDLIRRALERVDGVQSRAAQLLGTGFRSFRYRLQKYGMIERGAGPDGGPEEPAE